MSVTNSQRAAWALSALEHFATETGSENENDMTRLSDLLADLMHFCRKNAKAQDCPMNFESALFTARQHFDSEVKEDSDG